MAYTIVKSDGTVLTTIPDGTINTSSTSLGLPGRNYAGYGQALDTNFVHLVENFADSTPPPNPVRGQLWFNTNNSTLNICPSDGESNALAWISLASTSGGGTTTFGSVTVSGNLLANNITANGNVTSNNITTSTLTVTSSANITNSTTGNANIANLTTSNITTGGTGTAGVLTGAWTVNGSATLGGFAGTALLATGGNLVINNASGRGIVSDYYYYSNGQPISFSGAYSNSNVAAFLPTFNGNILTVQTQATTLTTGANTTAGTITGNWTLSTGSRLQATNAAALLQNTSTATTVYPTFTTSGANGNSSAVFNTSISANLSNSSITATTFVGNLSGNATTAATVTTNAQPNITSVGTLTGLTVNGTTQLGSISNVKITGGTSGQVITTDGTGNLTWGSGVGTITAVTTASGSGLTGGGTSGNLSLSVASPTLRNVTSGYTNGGRVNITASAPASPNAGDVWFDISALPISLSNNGYYALPGGLTVQWGYVGPVGTGTHTLTFPIAFSSTPYSLVTTEQQTGSASNKKATVFSLAAASATMNVVNDDSGTYPSVIYYYWVAIGPT